MNNGINLVVKRVDPKQQKIQKQNRLIRLIGFGLLGIFTLFSVVLFIFLQTSPITSLRADEQALASSLTQQNEKIQSEVLINKQLTHINEIIGKRSDLPDVVTSLLSIMPPTVAISSYQAANGLVELSIESTSLSDLEIFFDQVTALAQDGDIYQNVTISGISYTINGTYSFGMSVTN